MCVDVCTLAIIQHKIVHETMQQMLSFLGEKKLAASGEIGIRVTKPNILYQQSYLY